MFSSNNNTEVGRNGNIHIYFVGVYTRKEKKEDQKEIRIRILGQAARTLSLKILIFSSISALQSCVFVVIAVGWQYFAYRFFFLFLLLLLHSNNSNQVSFSLSFFLFFLPQNPRKRI